MQLNLVRNICCDFLNPAWGSEAFYLMPIGFTYGYSYLTTSWFDITK